MAESESLAKSPDGRARPKDEARKFEDWATELRADRVDSLIARRAKGWPIGRLVTRAEFEAALQLGRDLPLR